MQKKLIFSILIILIFALIFISGCMTVSELRDKSSDLIGEKVVVSGVVKNSIKIGSLSGFTLEDKKTGETIFVSTSKLREEGKKVLINGVLMKEIFVGYYILETENNPK